MVYLIAQFWFWLVGAFAIGCAVALLTRHEEPGGKIAPWLVWSLLAFGLGAVAAFLHVLLGRAGVWLETGLIAFACFLGGAAVGVLMRSGRFSEHKGWALGLLPAAILWCAANIFQTPDLEAGLGRQVAEAVKNAGGSVENFTISGRDALLSVDAPNRDHLERTIDNVSGVRRVGEAPRDLAEIHSQSAAPQTADGSGGLDVGVKTASGDERAQTESHAAKDAAGAPAASQNGVAAGRGEAASGADKAGASSASANAALSTAERTRAAQRTLKALPESGPLETAACQSALDATLLLGRLQFTANGGGVRAAAVPALNQAAALLQRCPETKAEVGGHTDIAGNEEANRALSQRQADTVVNILARMGVAAERLTAIGYGAKMPISPKSGSAENRRIQIILR
jgi:outer membrane protein OmpA-like peptidoglycan-associated protein